LSVRHRVLEEHVCLGGGGKGHGDGCVLHHGDCGVGGVFERMWCCYKSLDRLGGVITSRS
jgi:hypothetical protein